LPIIVALSSGPARFKDLQRSLEEITPKILSKELKELELNEFVTAPYMPLHPLRLNMRLPNTAKAWIIL